MTVTPILVRALRYGAVVAVVVAVVAGGAGALLAGVPGLAGGLMGAALAAVFLGLTAGSMLVAGRVTRGDGGSPVFYGIVLGALLLKLIAFVVLALLLRGATWLNPAVFGVSVIAAVLGSLAADVVAVMRARVPYVSDVRLPGEDPRD